MAKIDKMAAIIDQNEDMKNVLNANLMVEQNKALRNQLTAMHRQLNTKDEEIEKLQQK